MSLRDLNEPTRRRLRRDAWLLTLWCVSVGLFSSWLLLHGLHVRDPAVRYAMSAVLMYAIGLVAGARIWLVRFSRSVAVERHVLGAAGPGERADFDAEQAEAKRSPVEKKSSIWGDLLSGALDVLSFDEAAALLVIPALVVAVVGLLLAAGLWPALLMDGLAGLLAEVAVQFVFGALIARRVIGPRAQDDAFMSIVAKTWLAGVLLVVASAAAGWLLTQLNPGGASVADLLR